MPTQSSNGDRRPLIRHPGKTTYILGAGFSKVAGVPLLRNFVPDAFALMKDRDTALTDEFAQLLEKYAPIARSVNIDLDNLEDLFCLVDLPSGREPERRSVIQEYKDRDTLVRIIIRTVVRGQEQHEEDLTEPGAAERHQVVGRRYLHGDLPPEVNEECRPREGLGVSIHEAFVSYLLHCQKMNRTAEKGRSALLDLDCIITLNYDLVIERALRDFQHAYWYYGPRIVDENANVAGEKDDCRLKKALKDGELGKVNNIRGTLQILKLHGSINWRCSNPRDFTGVNEIWDPLGGSDDARNVPLVPPTWRKDASATSIFARMTQEAVRHLCRAGRIVIIGYSMPTADRYFRYLLAKGLNTPEFPKIEVWDVKGEHEMKAQLIEVFGKPNIESGRVRYSDKGFHGFVQEHPSEL